MIHDAIVHKITRRNPFLQDWPYYGTIDILNPTTTAQYQHNVTIPTKPGMMHDFRDLRFFQADGTEMPFWNESKTDGSTSFNWIKPYSASNKKAYVFYGNRDAITQSNGDKTFEFFDDFLGSALDTTKWTPTNMTTTISGGVCQGTANNAAGGDFKTNTYPFQTNMVFCIKYKQSSFTSNTYSQITMLDSDNSDAINIVGLDDATKDGYFSSKKAGTGSATINLGLSSTYWTNYGVWEIIRNGASSVVAKRNGTTLATISITTYIPTVDLALQFLAYPNGDSVYADYTYVRKHTATEPVCQFNQSGLRNPAYR